jgi:peptidoglycan/xylan/chitin deacetylase (PgdA/CDA1 family)
MIPLRPICLAALVSLAAGSFAFAAPCPHPEALGTSRVLAVDPDSTPRVGLKSFPETLPLADKEVVLTFDDGPLPPLTTRLLDSLAAECARATFFIVGQNAKAHPSLVRRIAAEGHTIGYHSWSHPNLTTMPFDSALDDIQRGIAATEAALAGASAHAAPFFRFPYYASTPALLRALESRHIAVFGADFWASDWEPMTSDETFKLATERLAKARRGIILFHDVQARTVAMMPAFLRHLRANGYRLVHIVPATGKVAGHGPDSAASARHD